MNPIYHEVKASQIDPSQSLGNEQYDFTILCNQSDLDICLHNRGEKGTFRLKAMLTFKQIPPQNKKPKSIKGSDYHSYWRS